MNRKANKPVGTENHVSLREQIQMRAYQIWIASGGRQRSDPQQTFGRKSLTQSLCDFTLRGALAIIVGLGMGSYRETASAGEVHLPPVNLGDTSFEDGIAFPGWLAEEIFGYYYAGQINDSSGEKLPGSNKFTTVSAITHVAFVSKLRLLGGFYAAEFLIPLADVESDSNPGQTYRTHGVGDLTVSPFALQWNDQKLFGKPYFQRFVFDVVLPTGQYDRNQPINIGNNVVSLNPYYAFTYIPTEKFELSVRLHYLWNSQNDQPFTGLGANTIQPGQAFHANFAASYQILPELRLGFNGYALQQVTEDRVNGRSQPNSEERAFGIGPGIVWHNQAGGIWIYINSYFETGVENRPEGTSVIFRVTKAF
jgi:hypothetical protein